MSATCSAREGLESDSSDRLLARPVAAAMSSSASLRTDNNANQERYARDFAMQGVFERGYAAFALEQLAFVADEMTQRGERAGASSCQRRQALLASSDRQ